MNAKTVQSLAVSLLGWARGDLKLDTNGNVRQNDYVYGEERIEMGVLAYVVRNAGLGYSLMLTPEGAEFILQNLQGCYTKHQERVLQKLCAMKHTDWLNTYGAE